MNWLYLGALLVSISGLLLIDRRHRLFFWRDPVSAVVVTAVGLVYFLAWDVAGIAAGIFLRGDAAIATGLVLAPELPVEEPVFLFLLVQCLMVTYIGASRLRDRAEHRAGMNGNAS